MAGRVGRYDDERIRRLESDLAMARYALIDLMAPEAQSVLRDVTLCKDRDSLWSTARQAAERILGLCQDVDAATQRGYQLGAPRANCPLCKAGSTSPYDNGFALPEGLTRHLLGSHNSRQCPVFNAAMELAVSHIDRLDRLA